MTCLLNWFIKREERENRIIELKLGQKIQDFYGFARQALLKKEVGFRFLDFFKTTVDDVICTTHRKNFGSRDLEPLFIITMEEN